MRGHPTAAAHSRTMRGPRWPTPPGPRGRHPDIAPGPRSRTIRWCSSDAPSIGLIGSRQSASAMLDRGAARPSTAPGPGPRAGRCAAPAPRTANARRDPGPIVGSLRPLGWGRVHDASRPGGSGAGTARRGAPRPAFSSQTLRAYSPGSCLLLRAGHVQFTSPREVMRSTTAARPGVPPGRPQASR